MVPSIKYDGMMLVYGGIDEAGYGPMFGPLCVGSCVLVLKDHDPADGAPDIWDMLDHIICRKRKDAKSKIAVNDSKQLKSNAKKKALTHLERGVFAFMSAMGIEPPTCDTDFFNELHCTPANFPWYGSITNLPIGNDVNMLRIDCSRLRSALDTANISCEHMECTAVDVEKYNERTAHATKSALNFSIAMQHANRIVQKFPTEHPRLMIDRHGGKIKYRNDLQLFWPEAKIQVLIENPSMSRYRLNINGKLATMTFASKSDERHMPAALASMIAKYTRELQMLRFNRYFIDRMPELKPTAGYVQDGRRFLQEIEPILAQNGIKRELLVRSS
jgi:ribonuclease HII